MGGWVGCIIIMMIVTCLSGSFVFAANAEESLLHY